MPGRGMHVGLCAAAVVTAAGLLAAQGAPAPQPPPPPPATGAPPPQTDPAPASQATQRPSFRGGVDVVSLNVTVTDPSRNFVTSLEQGDFVVFEDGVKQDVTYFNKAQ